MLGCVLWGESFFCSGLMKYQHFLICWWIRAPILSQCMLLVRFSESRIFCIGLTKYQQFWFFDRFVCCIGRPFDLHSWALRNHSQIENVKTAQCFSYVFETRSNHIESIVVTSSFRSMKFGKRSSQIKSIMSSWASFKLMELI